MENRLEEMTVRAECAEMVCRETQIELLRTVLEMCRHEDGSRGKLRKLKHIARACLLASLTSSARTCCRRSLLPQDIRQGRHQGAKNT